jgi:hypothetical protein
MIFRKKKKVESKKGSDQTAKGLGLASSLSIYYILMLFLISIPLIVFFMVMFLRALIDYRFYIFSGCAAMIFLGGFLLYRFRGRFKKKIIKESVDVMEAVRSAAGDGQTVHISILGGLMNVTYEGDGCNRKELDWNEPSRALPAPGNGRRRIEHHGTSALGHTEILNEEDALIDELENLYQLKMRGVLTDGEYETAKRRLLRGKAI